MHAFVSPLPPLPTQKNIAAILDEGEKLRQLNKQLIQKYDALTQSVFLDMFGDPVTNPKGWEKKTLKKVCFKITDGSHHSPAPRPCRARLPEFPRALWHRYGHHTATRAS